MNLKLGRRQHRLILYRLGYLDPRIVQIELLRHFPLAQIPVGSGC